MTLETSAAERAGLERVAEKSPSSAAGLNEYGGVAYWRS